MYEETMVALLIIANTWKQIKCHEENRKINYDMFRKRECNIWMCGMWNNMEKNLISIIQMERNQIQESRNYTIPCKWHLLKRKTNFCCWGQNIGFHYGYCVLEGSLWELLDSGTISCMFTLWNYQAKSL